VKHLKPATLLTIAAIIIIVTPIVGLTNNPFLLGGEEQRANISNFPPFPALAYFVAGMGFFKMEKKRMYLIAIGLFSLLSIAWPYYTLTVIILSITFFLFRQFTPNSETFTIFGKNSLTGYAIEEATVYLFGWHSWSLFMIILLPVYTFSLSRVLKLMQKYDLTVERFLHWVTNKIASKFSD